VNLEPTDPRLAWWAPQPVAAQPMESGTSAMRLDRFSRAAAGTLAQQLGPLANLRSSAGCALVVATDSPWITVHLERLRHHQPIPQSLAVEVDHDGTWQGWDGEDLRPMDGDVAVRLPTGLERGGPVRPCWVWMPTVSTAAIAGVALAPGAMAARTPLPEPAWLAIGDSLTQGFSVQSPRASWVHRAMRHWNMPAWNAGIGGIGVEPAVFSQLIQARPWRLVTIALGSNHAWQEASLADLAERTRILAEQAATSQARQVVWIIPGWKPCEDGKGPADFAGVRLDAAAGARFPRIRAAIREALAPLAPRITTIEDLTPRDARMLPDGLHPQAWASAVMAQRLTTAIVP
jgi:lysophospholipase L1-like esterase